MAGLTEKKLRTESAATKQQQKPAGSRLFDPYRAIGYITSNIPHSIQYRGQSAFITTGIGRSFHVYDADKITLLFVGPHFAADITSVISIGDETFASSGGQVTVCRRGKKVCDLEAVNRGEISNLMQFGDHIMAISEDNTVVIWNKDTRELFTEIEFQSESFQVTSIVHPSTYVNKVVIGSAQGTMQVWNIQTRRCLYEFKSFGSGISCMAQTPVIDVLALGLLDGRVLLHNVKQDRAVMQLSQEGRVTAVSFRTDDVPMMATANAEGDVALWDLNNKRLLHVLQGAHDSSIPSIDFLTGQPMLVTSSADNSIKHWLFDGQDGVPRLLRHRSGHFSAPQLIRYHDEQGFNILSAGRDRALRLFSVIRDSQSVEMSQGSLAHEARTRNIKISQLRLPQVTQFASNPAMTRDWDDVITCHQGSKDAHTWSTERKALGKYTVQSPDSSMIKSVAISACGNFGFLGLASGSIVMINMQSGLTRRTFAGHSKPVTGIQTDACNRQVYSTSLDGTLRIWEFSTGQQQHCVDLQSPPSRLVLHRESGLLACVCDDACVRVVDSESQRVVRKFAGHRNRITDLTFSNDGRWIVTASLDSTIRTWDLPTGHMIDWFCVESVPVSLTFSPTGDFLATAHMDSVGIYLWANRTQFTEVTLRQINPNTIEDDEATSGANFVAMPTSAGFANDEDVEQSGDAAAADESAEAGVYVHPEQLTDNMVTLSSLPKSKWQTLLSLATIKKRNAPERAPKAPELAPFFLPTVEGLAPRFDLEAKTDDGAEQKPVDRTKISTVSAQSGLARALYRAQETMAFNAVFEYLKKLNPSAIDLEIRTLPLNDNLKAVKAFIRASTAQLQSKRDFELVQAYLQVFLSVFADIIKENSAEIEPLLKTLRKECKSQWNTVDGLIRYSACMVEFMRTSK
ncbi:Utp21 specific WD40 associated putative domain-containing protein [Kickxella alabastrina]|uniref:Utp21 specific WD40 associated putative domain-containing protein n=1 Tax=Kickxella alabastrina TaxID=61397 RepID=UPI00221F61C0|nr:Utp21 specific WD40 associated putative domain-containing protein [Kickxella alabastrina]KAI7834490.1 Utp21 specific WD40 associated putative domain-containing protein [Kickxella alabastrina]KAJ1945884.1 rRNA-processing protein utp21 [Kickxella alabastrina]